MIPFKPIQIEETFINGKRHYKSQKSDWLPSVTTILSSTKDNSFLKEWEEKNPGKKEAAAARGTAVHSAIEKYLGEGILEDNSLVKPYIKSIFPILKKLTPLFLEAPILNPNVGYAGRVDCGAFYDKELPLIIDWKTSEKYKRSWYDYPYQLAAYLHGFKYTYPDFPINFEYMLIVCATPTTGQIELYEPWQVQQYWQGFLHRVEQYKELPVA